MQRLDLRNFKGLAPKLASRLKEATYADAVTDAKLWEGTIRNFPCPTVHCQVGAFIKTITPLPNCECLTWDALVHGVMDCGLWFYTGDGTPKISASPCTGQACEWGFPCPTKPPTVENDACTTDTTRYVAYAYTRLMKVGTHWFESAMSPPSTLLAACDAVVINGMSNPHACAAGFRVYRAESGLQSGNADTSVNNAWFLVAEVAADGVIDQLHVAEPASPLLDEWGSPPDDLHHLHITESGVMLGLSGDELWYTLPGEPMTWSKQRRRKVRGEWGISLALAVHKDDVYVLTDNKPVHYRVSLGELGVQLQRELINKYLPLSSLTSLSSGYQGVVYASAVGLVLLNGGQAQVISSAWFNRDQWQRLNPSTITGVIYQDAYVFASSVEAFLFEFGDRVFADNPHSTLVGLDLGGRIVGASAMYAGDVLYWAKEGVVYRWDAAAMGVGHYQDEEVLSAECCPFFYRPAIEDVNSSATYTAAEVHVRSGSSVVFRRYEVDCGIPALVDEEQVEDCSPFRLVGCRRNEDTRIELSGCGTVDSVTLGTGFQALRGR